MKNIKSFNDWEKNNEGLLAGIALTTFGLYQLVKWIGKVLLNKARRKLVAGLMPNLKISSIMKYGNKDGKSDPVLNIGDYGDRYFIPKTQTLFGTIPSLRILKNEKVLIYEALPGPNEGEHIRIPLTEEEYQDFMNVIKVATA